MIAKTNIITTSINILLQMVHISLTNCINYGVKKTNDKEIQCSVK